MSGPEEQLSDSDQRLLSQLEKSAETERKRSESMKRAWAEGKGKFAGKKREPKLCKCGCGQMTSKYADYVLNHNFRGSKHSKVWVDRQSAGLKSAHLRGVFVEAYKKRKAKTLQSRPLCACGCGNRVERSGFKYYKNHFKGEGHPAEFMHMLRQKRDMVKLCAENSKRLLKLQKEWKESGQLDSIRRKAGIAKGMLDHLSAKQWKIRSPLGDVYLFSNLSEWARQHVHLFQDDRPQSKTPFWLRISGGIADMLNVKGRSCSYRGWVAVSKTELDRGAPDLLQRQT